MKRAWGKWFKVDVIFFLSEFELFKLSKKFINN